mgnify:CR=1 FL=1
MKDRRMGKSDEMMDTEESSLIINKDDKKINEISKFSTTTNRWKSKFRLQYNSGENVENTIYAQFIFGMGPHSHVLN